MTAARWTSIAILSIALTIFLVVTHSTELQAAGLSGVTPIQAHAPVAAGGHAGSAGTASDIQPIRLPARLPSSFPTAIMRAPTTSSQEPSNAGGRNSGSSAPSSPAPDQSTRVIQLAEQDLAKRIGVPLDQIRLLAADKTSWPDGSLGFPQPGLTYSQIVTAGYQIMLGANGQTYVYHSDTNNQIVYCGTRQDPTRSQRSGVYHHRGSADTGRSN